MCVFPNFMFSAVLKMTLRALDYAVCIYTKRTEKAEISPTQILQPNIPHALQENISSPSPTLCKNDIWDNFMQTRAI